MARNTRKLNKPKHMDPSRTGLLRRKWVADLRRRLEVLKRDITKELLSDRYVVRSQESDITANFIFKSVYEASRRFNEWLWSRLKDLVLEEIGVIDKKGSWIDGYVDTAYFKGAESANYSYTKKVQPTLKTVTPIKPFMQGPVALDKVRILKARAYEELRGVSQLISKEMGNILADGIVRGDSPRKVAQEMSKKLTTIEKTRTRAIARTETIRAHAEGQLQALEQLGVQKVGVDVEFTATMVSFDPPVFEKKVCPKCRELQGKVFPIDKSHGIIPVHPNCRCAWVPYF